MQRKTVMSIQPIGHLSETTLPTPPQPCNTARRQTLITTDAIAGVPFLDITKDDIRRRFIRGTSELRLAENYGVYRRDIECVILEGYRAVESNLRVLRQQTRQIRTAA